MRSLIEQYKSCPKVLEACQEIDYQINESKQMRKELEMQRKRNKEILEMIEENNRMRGKAHMSEFLKYYGV